MRRVDYVIHYVESPRRSVTFYRDAIGLQVRIEGDGYVEFEMDNTKFSLFDRVEAAGLIGREGGNPPCGEIGFLIEDVDGEAERLRGAWVPGQWSMNLIAVEANSWWYWKIAPWPESG